MSHSPHYHFDGTFGPMLYAIPLFCAVADVSFAMVAMGTPCSPVSCPLVSTQDTYFFLYLRSYCIDSTC